MLVLAVVSLGVPLALSLRDRVNGEVHSQALSQATVAAATAADLLGARNTRQLDALVRSTAGSVRGRVIVVDAAGRVIADSTGPASRGSNYATRPEVASALRGAAVQAQRSSRTLRQDILATAVPIVRGSATVGAVRITQSTAAVHSAVNQTVAKLALVAGTVLLLGLLAGALIARQVVRPLQRLESTAKRIAGGDMSARATVEGSSEQRSLSASFNEMATRVERLLGAQREFVADASHQLRTPLTALRLRLDAARTAGISGEAAVDLDAGTAEVDRLAVIVDELLVLSRADERELQGERLQLADAVRRAVERWRLTAGADGVTLHSSPGPGVAWCAQADLDRALDALIENAVRYSPPGGEVIVACRDGRVEVLDRGPGLAPGEEQVVFERFHRGRAGRQGPAGTGLGLTIARTLARAWRGDARLVNRDGGGAIGVIEFPAVSS